MGKSPQSHANHQKLSHRCESLECQGRLVSWLLTSVNFSSAISDSDWYPRVSRLLITCLCMLSYLKLTIYSSLSRLMSIFSLCFLGLHC